MTGADQFMTTKNAEGRVELAMKTDRMITIVEKLANLANTTGVVQPNNAFSLKDVKVLFMLSGMSGLIPGLLKIISPSKFSR